jgi:rhodanese-related sulfurtransferase
MQKLAEAIRPVVLDIGERDAFRRDHTPGALNIPVDELPVRAGIELAGAKVAIDCTRDEMWRCQAAGAMLGQQGLTQTLILVR